MSTSPHRSCRCQKKKLQAMRCEQNNLESKIAPKAKAPKNVAPKAVNLAPKAPGESNAPPKALAPQVERARAPTLRARRRSGLAEPCRQLLQSVPEGTWASRVDVRCPNGWLVLLGALCFGCVEGNQREHGNPLVCFGVGSSLVWWFKRKNSSVKRQEAPCDSVVAVKQMVYAFCPNNHIQRSNLERWLGHLPNCRALTLAWDDVVQTRPLGTHVVSGCRGHGNLNTP